MSIPISENEENHEEANSSNSISLMRSLLEKHSLEMMHGYLDECERLANNVQASNDALRETGYEDDGSFSDNDSVRNYQLAKMSEIARASSEYYEYMSTLPSAVRTLFMSTANSYFEHDVMLPPGISEEFRRFVRMMPSIQNVRPRSYVMPIDPITNKLAQLKEFNQITVARHRNITVQTAVTIDCPEHMKIDGDVTLTNYDKSIINAVVTILESGNSNFTIPMLYHAMTGKENPTIDDITFDDLIDKLETMRKLSIRIELTEEIRAHMIDQQFEGDLESFFIDGYLLPLNKYSGVVNGKRSEMYQIIDTPPLHTYAKLKKQIASVSIDLLKAPLNNTSTTIPLKTYLLARIEAMKNENNNITRDKILFSSIYRELESTEADKKKKKRIRDYTEIVLSHFVSLRYITKYQMLKSGRIIEAVRICWEKEDREAI